MDEMERRVIEMNNNKDKMILMRYNNYKKIWLHLAA